MKSYKNKHLYALVLGLGLVLGFLLPIKLNAMSFIPAECYFAQIGSGVGYGYWRCGEAGVGCEWIDGRRALLNPSSVCSNPHND